MIGPRVSHAPSLTVRTGYKASIGHAVGVPLTSDTRSVPCGAALWGPLAAQPQQPNSKISCLQTFSRFQIHGQTSSRNACSSRAARRSDLTGVWRGTAVTQRTFNDHHPRCRHARCSAMWWLEWRSPMWADNAIGSANRSTHCEHGHEPSTVDLNSKVGLTTQDTRTVTHQRAPVQGTGNGQRGRAGV